MKFIKWFNEISINDVAIVGGKNASLGEMYSHLTAEGVKIPNGFAVTSSAYFYLLESNGISSAIAKILKELNPENIVSLQEGGQKIRQTILNAKLPTDLQEEIVQAYRELSKHRSSLLDVAVRSSATAEDLPGASFAGQQETYLNVQGEQQLLNSCLKCFASLFTDRAISYRHGLGFEHMKVGLSICVQQMVRSDLGSSGVMFSIDTETGFKNAIVINSAYGLGENVVQGAVNPDEFYVFKSTLINGYSPIVQKRLGNKEFKMVYDVGGGKMVKNIPVSMPERESFSIGDEDVLSLARWACVIEDYYSKKSGKHVPMDMEWAKDGATGELFIVQARPETVQAKKLEHEGHSYEAYRLNEKTKVLVTGRSVGSRIGAGRVRIIKNATELNLIVEGEILVTDKTDPDWEPAMKKAAAIITNRGGRTCHAAIVSRELGVPAIVGTERATETLVDGQLVTVSCAEGETGFVYEGKLSFSVDTHDLTSLSHDPKLKIMMIVGNPAEAFQQSLMPNDGVGLARMEFIISSYIKIHPMALLRFDELKDSMAKQYIELVTKNYQRKSDFFVDKLSQGIGMIAAAFYPKDVIVRMSDFKTNEYANLIGGREFEPHEENPMLGFRGASRYYHPRYQEGFALECQAIKRVREVMGLKNVKIMIPFCRTVEEGRKVLQELENNGLKRGESELEVYVMCEIPSNVLLAEDFSDIFDGFSIGSNDLTQLVLGVDRDSEVVAPIFDERNPAVKKMISHVITKAHQKGRKVGICGQAPSDYPEFTKFLIEEGIDSISLNPDSIIHTHLEISKQASAVHKET